MRPTETCGRRYYTQMDRRCGPSRENGCFHRSWCGHVMDDLCLEPWAKLSTSCERLGGFCRLRLCGQCGGSVLLECQTSVTQQPSHCFPSVSTPYSTPVQWRRPHVKRNPSSRHSSVLASQAGRDTAQTLGEVRSSRSEKETLISLLGVCPTLVSLKTLSTLGLQGAELQLVWGGGGFYHSVPN